MCSRPAIGWRSTVADPADCIKVEAGIMLWGGVRRIAFRCGCDIEETRIGWVTRAFRITGTVTNLHDAAKQLADYLGPQEIE